MQETPLQGEARTPLIDSQVRNSVSDCIKFQPILHSYLTNKVTNFKTGCIAKDLENWKKGTSDSEVLNTFWFDY